MSYDGMRLHKYMSTSQAEYEVRGNFIHKYMSASQPVFEIRGDYIYKYMSSLQPIYEICGGRYVHKYMHNGENRQLPGITEAYQRYIDAGELMALFVTKVTDAKKPKDPFIIRRNGWTFDLLEAPTAEQLETIRTRVRQDKVQQDLAKLKAYLKEWSFKHHTKTDLVDAHNDMGLSRDDAREAIRVGLQGAYLVEMDLPESEKTRTRRRGIYLEGAQK